MINKKIIIASLATTVLMQSSTIGIFANETNINNQVKSIEQNINEDEIVNIPDENLNKNLKKTLFGDENSIRPIKKQDLLLIHRIDLSSKNIANLEGLQYCTNLEILSIDGNQISDITPLSKLTNLTSLGLGENQITDIGALANLTNLTSLTLTNNQIKDINYLKNLNKLTFLSLAKNQITDIGALANLTNLTSLRLDMNQITDIGALANLTNLTNLSLDLNQITDIGALTNLTNLTNLGLKDNRISDISSISNLINLTSLTLDKNQIKDISPLENLIDLPFLSVAYNQISDITPLSKLTNLTRLSIAYNQISDITPLSKMNKLERLYVYNQSVKSREVLSKGNTVAIENSIKTVDGSIVNATNISYGGEYNKDTNLIKWNNITSDFNATYEFNKNVSIGKTNATFSGIVTQPIKYKCILTHNKYINGYEDGTFRQENSITRGELSAMLARIILDGKPTPVTENKFNDISNDYWGKDEVNYLASKGILNGYEDGTFRPENPITRAEVATILVRANTDIKKEIKAVFPDVKEEYWAKKYIDKANELRYMIGYEDGTFRPENPITRAETVVTLNRIYRNPCDFKEINSNKIPFTDLDKNNWAYNDIIKSTISHEHIEK